MQRGICAFVREEAYGIRHTAYIWSLKSRMGWGFRHSSRSSGTSGKMPAFEVSEAIYYLILGQRERQGEGLVVAATAMMSESS